MKTPGYVQANCCSLTQPCVCEELVSPVAIHMHGQIYSPKCTYIMYVRMHVYNDPISNSAASREGPN